MIPNFTLLEGFEWDKWNLNHLKKHKVNYKECEEAFLDHKIIIFSDDKHSVYEERFKVFGKTSQGRNLALVFTLRQKQIRVIMARDQNKKERGDINEK